MQNRIFPNNTEVDMGSKLVFNSIDWTEVEDNMHNQKFANSHTEQIKSLLKLAGMDAEAEDHEGTHASSENSTRKASKDMWNKAYDQLMEKLIEDGMSNIEAEKYLDENYKEIDDLAADMTGDEIDKARDKHRDASSSRKTTKKASKDMWNKAYDQLMEKLIEDGMSNMEAEKYLDENYKEIDDLAADMTGDEIDKAVDFNKEDFGDDTSMTGDMSMPDDTYDDDYLSSMDDPLSEFSSMHRDEYASSRKNTRKAMRKIAFTHPNQISAEAIEKAKAAGDTKLVNTILAARKANRQRIASAIQTKLQNQNELAERVANREAILRKTAASSSEYGKMNERALEEMINKAGGFEKSSKALQDAYLSKTASRNLDLDFVSPTEFTKAQREAFNKIAQANGFPKEYINVMCAPVISPQVESLAQEARTIYSSNLSDKTKKTLLSSLIKEAELSNESKAAFIKYWNEDLGYQAKDFWPDVAANYTEGHKGK